MTVCALSLLGAVFFTAPEGGRAPLLDAPAAAPAEVPAHGLDGSRSRPMPPKGPGLVHLNPEGAAVVTDSAPCADVEAIPETFALSGSVIGHAPGHGEAWSVEAYRLTPERTAVLECRRVYVEPDGRLRLTGLRPGLWQTVLVSPRFAWGPLVDTAAPPAELRLGAESTGQICVETVTDGAAPRGVRLHLSLTAVRSPALEGSAVSLQRRVAARDIVMGETLTLEGVSEGTYEVSATLAQVQPDWGERPRSRSVSISVRPGMTHVELAFVEASHPAHVPTRAKAAALR